MKTDLMLRVNPVDASRPVMVPFRGGVLYVYLHDLWYAAVKSQFLQWMRETHPDAQKLKFKAAGFTFKGLRRSYLAFEESEAHFYFHLGLTPPRINGARGQHWDWRRRDTNRAGPYVQRTRDALRNEHMIEAYSQ